MSDEPADALESLAEEVRAEAKAELGTYKPELPGQGKAPSIEAKGEEVKEDDTAPKT